MGAELSATLEIFRQLGGAGLGPFFAVIAWMVWRGVKEVKAIRERFDRCVHEIDLRIQRVELAVEHIRSDLEDLKERIR